MPRTAVVHEWIAAIGGSENVAEIMADALDAEVFCLWREDGGIRFPGREVHESRLASMPLLRGRKAASLPVMPWVWKHTDLSAYDRIVASSHAFAHQVAGNRTNRDVPANVYVYTPARYVWAPELDVRGDAWWARAASKPLQRLDRHRVARNARFAAISEFVRQRVADCWDIDSDVIFPPVDVARIQAGMPWIEHVSAAEADILASLPDTFVLGASRFVEYKRLDAAIDVGADLGLPVVLAGSGPDRPRLEAFAAAAPVPVTFVERPSTELLYALYEAAALFVFAAVEDFGIMPVEAMATGTPALVNAVGGAKETVLTISGGGASDFSAPRLRKESAEIAVALDRGAVASRAAAFDTARFVSEFTGWVEGTGGGHA
jgi:glycosyltransferase involved in cell wall biosynthesis